MWNYGSFFAEKDSLVSILIEQGVKNNFTLPMLTISSMFLYLIILFFMLKIMSKNLDN